MRSGVSVCTSETQTPFRRPSVTNVVQHSEPIVLERESQASKKFLSVDEIKAGVLEVRSSLGFTPRKTSLQ